MKTKRHLLSSYEVIEFYKNKGMTLSNRGLRLLKNARKREDKKEENENAKFFARLANKEDGIRFN